MNYREMAAKIGVSETSFRKWRNRDERFIKALDERIRELN